MKKISKSVVGAFAVIAVILYFCNITHAQSYQGGEGAGYDSLPISVNTSISTSINQQLFDFSIYPNPITTGQILKAKIQGVEGTEKVKVTVLDMIGSKVYSDEVEASTDLSLDIPLNKLRKGIYLITLQYKHHKVTRRFTFIE